jgi:CHAT domain-containing protein/Tfp pilus assembly protein PilF
MFFVLWSIFLSFFLPPVVDSVSFFTSDVLSHSPVAYETEQLIRKGDFETAISRLSGALNSSRSLIPKREASQYYATLGLLNWNVGKLKESIFYFDEIVKSSAEDEPLRSICMDALNIIELYNEAKNERYLGNYQDSISIYQKAINNSIKIGREEFVVKCTRQMSLIYWEIEDIDSFFALNISALALARKLKLSRDESVCLNNIGLYYAKLDNLSQALSYYEKALELSTKTKFFQTQSDSLTNLGVLYEDIGEYDKALRFFSEALTLDEKSMGLEFRIIDLNNIGTALLKKARATENKEHLNKALEYFKVSLNLLQHSQDNRSKIRILNNIATTYSDLSDYISAYNYYSQALVLANARKDKEALGAIFNNIGIIQNAMGNFTGATESFKRAISLSSSINNNRVLWEAYLEIANLYKKQGNLVLALENYNNSISVIEHARSSIGNEFMKASFMGSDKRLESYHNIIDTLYSLKGVQEDNILNSQIFDYFERSKARAFLDILEISKETFSQGAPSDLVTREENINEYLSNLYMKLLNPDLKSQERNAIEYEINNKEDEHGKIINEIRLAHSKYADLIYPSIITLKETQRSLLSDDTLIITFSIGKHASYGLSISKYDSSIFSIPPRNELFTKISDYLKLISKKEYDESLGNYLYDNLLNIPDRSRYANLIIIPDDILYYLPFDLLRSEENVYLINNHAISYAPSISSLREIQARYRISSKKRPIDILALCGVDIRSGQQSLLTSRVSHQNSLTCKEIDKIEKYFAKNKKIIRKTDLATENNIKDETLIDFKILHFSAHAFIDDQKPMRSAILLSAIPDSKEDGQLQVREIYNIKTNADLITLSACETGLGRLVRGDGIEGLSRAFFYSGSSSILMSLWAVNDHASSFLMERFYYNLVSGRSIAISLQKAKIDLINSKEYAHPYFWAPFIITGNADHIIFPKISFLRKLLFILLMILAVLSFVFALSR